MRTNYMGRCEVFSQKEKEILNLKPSEGGGQFRQIKGKENQDSNN